MDVDATRQTVLLRPTLKEVISRGEELLAGWPRAYQGFRDRGSWLLSRSPQVTQLHVCCALWMTYVLRKGHELVPYRQGV